MYLYANRINLVISRWLSFEVVFRPKKWILVTKFFSYVSVKIIDPTLKFLKKAILVAKKYYLCATIYFFQVRRKVMKLVPDKNKKVWRKREE